MGDLAEYKSVEEAHKDHIDNYRTHGYGKGKYDEDGPDSIRIKRIMEPIEDGALLLDIGCNDGGLGLLLQPRGVVVYGIDLVSELVESACGKGVIATQGAAEDLRFRNDFFEVVNMSEVLEHLYDPEIALREIARVLVDDGIFTGSVPHPDGGMGHGHKADYHQQVFDMDNLKELLCKYFEEVELQETPYSPEYCHKYSLDKDRPQWINWVCKGVRADG